MGAKTTAADYRHLLKRYAEYAPRYDRRFARYTAATLENTLAVIPADSRATLLDVACGTGVLISMLRESRAQLHCIGVDLSPDMLAQARQRIPGDDTTTWMIGRAEVLPVAAHSIDIITCTNAFHLVQDAHGALREFMRVLKAGGTLVLVDWCSDYPQMRLLSAVTRIKDHQPRNVRRLSATTALLEEAGFSIVEADRFIARALWGMMRIVATSNGTAAS